MIVKCLAVGIGGFIGSVARFLLSGIKFPKAGNYPVGTLLVNVIGAVIIGMVIAHAEESGMTEERLLFLKTGLCGGLTTFSTFSVETFNFFESGNYPAGVAYVVITVVLCILGVYLGMRAGSAF